MATGHRVTRGCGFLALAGALGCGLLGAPERASGRPDDGLGPFLELTPVELCEDGARWTSDGRPAAGFCAQGSPRPCAGDGACGVDERCVCGRCTVARCGADGDCRAGELCDGDTRRCARPCVSAGDCGALNRCQGGVCVRSCGSPGQCSRGELCTSEGLCVALPCEDDGACGGDRCELQRVPRPARDPSVLLDRGRWRLFVASPGRGVVEASGSDGVRFRVEGTRLEGALDGPSVVSGPFGLALAARRDDGVLVLSVAPDGQRFGPVTELLRAQEAWEGSALRAPSLALAGGAVWLLYEGSGGLGLARLEGLGTATVTAQRMPSGPDGTARVLSVTEAEAPPFWRALGPLEGPSVVAEDPGEVSGTPLLRVYFSALGAATGASVVDRVLRDPLRVAAVGVASGRPGGRFRVSPVNPVLSRVVGVGELRGALEPSVVRAPDGWRVYLRDRGPEGGSTGLLVARGRGSDEP
ncbi:MAG: hypothetical protein HY909_02995 [Deltaproteobacteria bacterium]|nr:hypothetical protein [Deltaproteobacteria bacterium]